MFNINELEKKWLRYKIKSYIPHAIIVVVMSVMILGMINYQSIQNIITKKAPNIEKVEDSSVPKNEVPKTTIQGTQNHALKEDTIEHAPTQTAEKKIEQPIHKDTKIVISPSLNFINEIGSATTSDLTPEKVTPLVTETPIEEIEVMKEVEIKEIPTFKNEVKNSVNIKRQNTQSDIEDVIKRFKKNNSPALSLFIAKNYFELGDYNQAYNYALITNEIDNNIEASWIIFAKSLVKLGQKDKAIATLKEYIKHSKSSNAKTLLDEIVLGGKK